MMLDDFAMHDGLPDVMMLDDFMMHDGREGDYSRAEHRALAATCTSVIRARARPLRLAPLGVTVRVLSGR
jgi:hypothetical protein